MKTINDLKNESRWMCYDHNKKPRNPKTLAFGGHTKIENLVTYKDAQYVVDINHDMKGTGIVFYGDGLVGIDLDDCYFDVDGEEHLQPYAQYLITLAESYTERSPSGKGIHILGYGKLPKALTITDIDGTNVEAYENGRYFTFTENMVSDTDTINDIQHVIDEIYSHAIPDAKTDKQEVLKPESLSPQRVSYDYDNPPSSEYMRDLYERLVERAVGMMDSVPDGHKFWQRWKSGRLLGGIAQAFRDAGLHTHSDEQLVDMVYHRCVPESNQRTQWKTIEAGFEKGKLSPVRLSDYYPKRRVEQLVPHVAPQKRIINEETGEVMDNPTQDKEYFLTDAGNARRFADTHNGQLYWVVDRKQWVKWNGKYWQDVYDESVVPLAEEVALSIHESAIGSSSDGSKRVLDKTLAKWAIDSQSKQRLTNMVELAKSHMQIMSNVFDTHPNLVNMKNGIYDILTGKMLKHDPKYFLSMYANNDADFNKETPFFDEFLNTIFNGDKELIRYFMKMLGYSVTGYIDEHALFFLYGMGRNGKSTATALLNDAFGNDDARCSYGVTIDILALMDSKVGEGATPTLASLMGKRFAFANELPENRAWNEALVKSLTGGDAISARELFRRHVYFKPTHKFWVTGNHLPRVNGTDEGIRRRLKYIPFTTTIPDAKVISTSEIRKLFNEEMTGIVAKILTASTEWKKSKLGKCTAVDSATNDYLDSQDIYQQFVNECLVYDEKFDQLHTMQRDGRVSFGRGGNHQGVNFLKVHKSILFKVFQAWANDIGEYKKAKNIGQNKLTGEFKRKHFYECGQGWGFLAGIDFNAETIRKYSHLIPVGDVSSDGMTNKEAVEYIVAEQPKIEQLDYPITKRYDIYNAITKSFKDTDETASIDIFIWHFPREEHDMIKSNVKRMVANGELIVNKDGRYALGEKAFSFDDDTN
jgi:putative DNA primase/helicase